MAKDYSQQRIKEYKYWTLSVFENQGYLGRCVVWCKRDDALDLTDSTGAEQKELILILRQLKNALHKAFRPDWMNYAFLGNETRHLHAHVIPRYKSSRTFVGIKFEDKLFGHNYWTNKNFITSNELLFAVRDKIRNNI